MILVKAPPKKRFHKLIQTISFPEVAFLLGAVAFIALVFVYADYMRATVSGENYVRFSKPSGFYEDPFELTLEAIGGNTEIRYTLDGFNPDSNSLRYGGPIPIDKTVVLKAIEMQDGQAVGKIQTQTFFMNESSTLPIVSIVTDPANLWDPKKGIYVEGVPDEGSEEEFIPNDMRRGPEWQPAAYMEFFDEDGHKQFALEGNIKVHGHASRRFPQKSLRFCASGGQYMEYKFFEDSDVDEYKCVLLRNGGNDWLDTLFRDSLVQSLMSDTSLDIQHAQPAIVFLNGEYWGIHTIRDAQNDYYFHTKYGLDRDGIVIIFPDKRQGGYPLVEEGSPGDEEPYVAMVQFVEEHDMADQSNYEYVQSLMDVDNYIDYMVLNIYSSNADWSDSNLRVWRYKNETGDFRDAHLPYAVDGRWRWVVYDMDSAMASPTGTKDTLDRAINPIEPRLEWSTTLFKNLLKNPEFKQKFIDRFIYHYNDTFEPEIVISRINEYQEQLRPEIERHVAKWGGLTVRDSDEWVSFKDVEEWEARVQLMRDFAVNRQNHALEYLSEQFKMDGTVALRVIMSEGGSAVHIGDLRIDQDGWTGRFVQDFTYPVSVESKFGYDFSGWESSLAMTDPTELRLHDVNEADEVVLTAKFEKNLVGKFLSAIGIQL